jgi:hypothetical protein
VSAQGDNIRTKSAAAPDLEPFRTALRVTTRAIAANHQRAPLTLHSPPWGKGERRSGASAKLLVFVFLLTGLFGCGTIYHQPDAGFSEMSTGKQFQDDAALLRTKYNGDAVLIARDLEARGATCSDDKVDRFDRSVSRIGCRYYFCKGTWRQMVFWSYEKDSRRSTEAIWKGHALGTGNDVILFDFTFDRSEACKDRTHLREYQLGNIEDRVVPSKSLRAN